MQPQRRTDLHQIVLCTPVRTALGTFNGTLMDMLAVGLGAVVIRAPVERVGRDPARVDGVVMGNVIQTGNKMNPARQAAIGGGVPVSGPALTVNRVCGSGAHAIASAAQEIRLGEADVIIAGGMENMDRMPYLLPNGRWGMRMGDEHVLDSMLLDGLNDAFSGEHSGWHTEDLVARPQMSSADQNAWALRSQTRFSAAQAAGQPVDPVFRVGGVTAAGRSGEPSRPVDHLLSVSHAEGAAAADALNIRHRRGSLLFLARAHARPAGRAA
ncbi:beta-ketoacyl synthase N-terminal-like domain-containing protein [Dankookia sp. GCM10030260]|uniref:thiolase family protein n=1 Tax=Dankookia sp. GCM10030260 TaxID=3273390 RepID=UPI00360746D0